MTSPLYPSMIPRFVDESWFASDQPVDEAAKLNELEANHEVWIREAQYRNVDVHQTHGNVETIDEEANDDDDEDEINEDDEDEDDEIEEGDDIDDDYMTSDQNPNPA